MKALIKNRSMAEIWELRRFLRAGETALRALVELLPSDWDPRSGDEDVCVIFTDIAGYSDFVAAAGDDAAIRVLRTLDDVVAEALQGRRGARVVKRLGDGYMLVCRRPEDAIAIARSLVHGFAEAADTSGIDLNLRAGAHRGTCRRHGEDYFGYHVNLAARVAEAARPGQAVVTANVLAGTDLDALGLHAHGIGPLRAKGVSSHVELFTVTEEPAEERGLWNSLLHRLTPD